MNKTKALELYHVFHVVQENDNKGYPIKDPYYISHSQRDRDNLKGKCGILRSFDTKTWIQAALQMSAGEFLSEALAWGYINYTEF